MSGGPNDLHYTDELVRHVERIEAILRANRMHEGTCASVQPVWLPEPAHAIPRPPCDCWLSDAGPA